MSAESKKVEVIETLEAVQSEDLTGNLVEDIEAVTLEEEKIENKSKDKVAAAKTDEKKAKWTNPVNEVRDSRPGTTKRRQYYYKQVCFYSL